MKGGDLRKKDWDEKRKIGGMVRGKWMREGKKLDYNRRGRRTDLKWMCGQQREREKHNRTKEVRTNKWREIIGRWGIDR